MKYCSKCGKELIDEAVICTGCGCEVQRVYSINKKDSHEAEKDGMKAVNVLNFISNIFQALCISLLFVLLIYSRPYIDWYERYLWLDYNLTIVLLVFSSVSFIMNLTTLVVYLVHVKEKAQEKTLKYIFTLIMATLVLVLGIFAFI